jgi:hypothetical protein
MRWRRRRSFVPRRRVGVDEWMMTAGESRI